MNWEAIGAVGEILSAMGVVVTLGYLAVQIRQSNAIASWETHRSAVAGFSDAFQNIANDADNARVYRCGLFDLQSLAPDDRLRFSNIVAGSRGNRERQTGSTGDRCNEPDLYGVLREYSTGMIDAETIASFSAPQDGDSAPVINLLPG